MLIVRRNIFSGLPGARPLDADRMALRFEVELEFDKGDLAREDLGLDGVRNFES